MRLLSFAYTTAPLLARVKRVTRRQWSADYALRFRAHELIRAYDRDPRYRGKHVADVRLIRRPYLQPISEMPDGDYELEGFRYLYEHPETRPRTIFGEKVTPHTFSWEWFEEWRASGESYWVVRFELVRVVEARAVPAAQAVPLFTYAGVAL